MPFLDKMTKNFTFLQRRYTLPIHPLDDVPAARVRYDIRVSYKRQLISESVNKMFDTTIPLPSSQIEDFKTGFSCDTRMQNEQALVRLAQQGDLDAFNQLVLTYQDLVYRQTYWILGEKEAAEDAAQEAFCRAYQKMHTCKGPSFRAWVLRIATNYCFDEIRKSKCHPTYPLENVYPDSQEENENASWLVDPDSSPEETVERTELVAMVNQCLRMMLPIYRLPILLVEIQEMNYQEAAEVMGLQMGTFKSRLFRARLQFIESTRRIPGFDRVS